MENPQGRVIQLKHETDPPRAVVEVVSSLRCARCAAGKGCGAGLLGGDDRMRQVEVRITGGLQLDVGDVVSISLAPNDLLDAAFSAYGIPLLGGLLFAAGAWSLGFGDLGAAVATLIGVVAGIVFSRWRLQRRDCLRRFTPVATGRVAAG